MPRVLQRSGSNSLSALLRAEPPDAAPDSDGKRSECDDDRRGARRRRRSCLGCPSAAPGVRVCSCDEMDSAAAAPGRRPPEAVEEEDDAACSASPGEGAALSAAHRPFEEAGAGAVAAASLSELPDDVWRWCCAGCRWPPSSPAVRVQAVEDLTVAPQFCGCAARRTPRDAVAVPVRGRGGRRVGALPVPGRPRA
ncbi:hypothetical protein EJB05_43921, partial [Eragrostis curvula]